MNCRFSYIAAETLDEVLQLLAENGPEAKLLAGGTDLLVRIRNGYCHPKIVVDIKQVPGFNTITWTETNGLLLGPVVTLTDIIASGIVQDKFPLIIACARNMGSNQIRNRATVVGNIASASPCSDMAPALLCLEANILAVSLRGSRSIPLCDFFTGVKKTVLLNDEIIFGLTVPPSTSLSRGAYLKLKRIKGQDLGLVCLALLLKNEEIRIAVGSCAQTPVVTPPIPVSTSTKDIVASILDLIHPISDIRCTAEYRRFMVEEYVKRLLKEVQS
ncbi:aerobic-type carbon monoxide dehydrogenase, middle subunit CoxM/CutM-like protein [Sphaerochaeta pleomorpha str. Grapes]|uniref:Aerobic-type carbon monoxide dehydrogenase, middle subunit CoxM/CutM-like protein n=1 Tax=Sphaerochaeta pleomorpha (strain ATCC BAA-1885 / DSM 22778 / Grapes) TaxID=158190 RepID=G8QUA1_SPHPG|nr:FAD binding domain-containing protein [Sphaerochaeta pleomorpha]AEV28071.1 aerobic-type carbon monoxide dehydrogenase, middle subunit CoxM/CutM-like protein [Sphaerochaeta pleomorpha str. Grapes]